MKNKRKKTALYHDCNYSYSDYSVLSDSFSQPHKNEFRLCQWKFCR